MPQEYHAATSRVCCACEQGLTRNRFGKQQYERFASPTCLECVAGKLRKAGKLQGAERQLGIDVFDSEAGAIAYSSKPHIRSTQFDLSERAMQLLCVPRSDMATRLTILDVGCGNGISSNVVQQWGHEVTHNNAVAPHKAHEISRKCFFL